MAIRNYTGSTQEIAEKPKPCRRVPYNITWARRPIGHGFILVEFLLPLCNTGIGESKKVESMAYTNTRTPRDGMARVDTDE